MSLSKMVRAAGLDSVDELAELVHENRSSVYRAYKARPMRVIALVELAMRLKGGHKPHPECKRCLAEVGVMEAIDEHLD